MRRTRIDALEREYFTDQCLHRYPLLPPVDGVHRVECDVCGEELDIRVTFGPPRQDLPLFVGAAPRAAGPLKVTPNLPAARPIGPNDSGGVEVDLVSGSGDAQRASRSRHKLPEFPPASGG